MGVDYVVCLHHALRGYIGSFLASSSTFSFVFVSATLSYVQCNVSIVYTLTLASFSSRPEKRWCAQQGCLEGA